MSHALKLNPVIWQAPDPAFLSATINGGPAVHRRDIKIPDPINFDATSTPTLEWKTYPQGEVLLLSAGRTHNGITVRFEIVFFVKPESGTYPISASSDRSALTYYSDPVEGTLHVGVSGNLNLTLTEDEGKLEGSFFGEFDHGGEQAEENFPIVGQFLVYGCNWNTKTPR